MIELRVERLEPARVHRFSVVADGRALTRREFAGRLQDDAVLRDALSSCLADEPFEALRFETPAWRTVTMGEPFEFVTVADRSLVVPPDPSDFDEHFERASADVTTFPNLGGDALLVVPCPPEPQGGGERDYAHLAAFCRTAPDRQRHALWRAVGEALAGRVGERPTWFSTAGGGVPWVHVRLDDRPKYYAWAPYRRYA